MTVFLGSLDVGSRIRVSPRINQVVGRRGHNLRLDVPTGAVRARGAELTPSGAADQMLIFDLDSTEPARTLLDVA
jgi:hypothetical protein